MKKKKVRQIKQCNDSVHWFGFGSKTPWICQCGKRNIQNYPEQIKIDESELPVWRGWKYQIGLTV